MPTVGHFDLPPGSRGDRFLAFADWLRITIADNGVGLIGAEAPILPKPFISYKGRKPTLVNPTNIATTTLLQGLFAVAQMVAAEQGVPFEEVNVSEAKKELAGFGGAEKADMVYVAEKVGLAISCHDEADAFASWLVTLRRVNKPLSAEWDRRIWSSRGSLI